MLNFGQTFFPRKISRNDSPILLETLIKHIQSSWNFQQKKLSYESFTFRLVVTLDYSFKTNARSIAATTNKKFLPGIHNDSTGWLQKFIFLSSISGAANSQCISKHASEHKKNLKIRTFSFMIICLNRNWLSL